MAVPHQQLSSNTIGAPNTLKHCMPMQMYGIQFHDDQGKERTQAVVKMGDSWYLAPNGEQWAAQLRPLTDDGWLSKQLNDALAAQAAQIPKADVADIFSEPGQ